MECRKIPAKVRTNGDFSLIASVLPVRKETKSLAKGESVARGNRGPR
jgi:hypothetical protein